MQDIETTTSSEYEDTSVDAAAAQAELAWLAVQYQELEGHMAVLEIQRGDLRAAIAVRVHELGDKAEVGGYTLEITSPTIVESYDAAGINRIVARLIAEGNPLALDITSCRKEQPRAGGLRVQHRRTI